MNSEEIHDEFDTFSSGSDSSNLDGEYDDAFYKKLIEEFPVGVIVWKLEGEKTIRVIYINSLGELYS